MSSSPGEVRAAASPPWPSPAAALGSRSSNGSTIPAPSGGGILLHPNGLAVLYALGLGEALRSRAHVSSAGSIRDERGRTILEVPVPNFGAGLDHVLAVRRSHLTGVLADAVAATPGIEVITGAEVIDAHSSGEVSYRVHGIEHRLVADVVVGADGVHSTVRKHGAFGACSKTRRSIYVRGTVDDAAEPRETAAEYWTPLGLFGVSPLGDGTTYFYADATAADVTAAIVDLDLERFRSVWTDVLPACRGVLDRIAGDGSLLVNAVRRVDCDTFVDGRLVLLGDAAHAMEPTLGQGANSAFVDAAVLAGRGLLSGAATSTVPSSPTTRAAGPQHGPCSGLPLGLPGLPRCTHRSPPACATGSFAWSPDPRLSSGGIGSFSRRTRPRCSGPSMGSPAGRRCCSGSSDDAGPPSGRLSVRRAPAQPPRVLQERAVGRARPPVCR